MINKEVDREIANFKKMINKYHTFERGGKKEVADLHWEYREEYYFGDSLKPVKNVIAITFFTALDRKNTGEFVFKECKLIWIEAKNKKIAKLLLKNINKMRSDYLQPPKAYHLGGKNIITR